ncbi:amino acid adenylation domain-containing protein [Mycolicibacterium sp. BK556]|uniref:non-ribosomal peptide synthetase n=1 Tax=unclassified Mycolicibacterium TaxID=2636767 RepID=UPI001612574E|nr:amino acid adenylation domain-containing protein [Mycolicibacterium sp. BK556]MBB3633482.1 amino acid adenylation domain-containing protein [Mycolicibacterium sp. BK607]
MPTPDVPAHYLLSSHAPAPRTLIEILHDTAARYPDAAAIDDGTVQLSYADLIGRIDAEVARLGAHGVGRGDRVGVRMPSGKAELYVAILAILAAGAAYVPVDADDPDERAALVFGEAGVVAVVTDTGIAGASPRHDTAAPSPEDDAWIIFTSGSTGTPKGVAVTHRNAAAFVDAEAQIFLQDNPIGPGDRVLAGLSVAFDASCEEMWLAWRHGACLVPAPRSLVRSGPDLGPWLAGRGVTVVSTVPTLAALWPSAALSGVRLLIFGGEACPAELAERLAAGANSAGREVWNTYGPTEATVVACAARLDGAGPVSIGLPLAGWDLAVVDADGNPVGYGETGELVIGGVGLARYLDPDQDAMKYAAMPTLGWTRAYRSGDLVRLEPDGLYFVGRADDQVKLGGRRIELGEIDAALMRLPGVVAGASAVRHTANGTPLLVGYIASAETEFDLPAARSLLAETLPAALIPRLVRLDELPVRTSGKVDRGALPWPPPDSAAQEGIRDDLMAPRDEVEATLAKIWCETLGLEAVSIDDDFFELGGDSLLAARISIFARAAGYWLTPRDLIDHVTLAELAERARSAPPAVNLPVPQGDTPLNPMQQYYFSWARVNPNKFNVGFVARLPALLDPDILRDAFRYVIDHHSALRLRFHRTTDGQVHARHEFDTAKLEVLVRTVKLPAGDDDQQIDVIHDEVERLHDSLDIDDGPTIAAVLFDDPNGTRHHLALAVHHLINDGRSLEIILEDLRTAYIACARGREPALPPQSTPFFQWVDALIDYARGPAGDAQWEYWLEQARDVAPFPEDDADAVAFQHDLAHLRIPLLSPDEVDEARDRLGGLFHPTAIHAITAGLALTAHEMSGQRSLVFHLAGHGRETCIPGADVSRTVGWFVTHTPITVRLPDGPLDDLPRILEQVTEQWEAVPHHGLGHSALRYFSDDPRVAELARFDQVTTLLNYVGDIWEASYDGEMFTPPMSARLADMQDSVGSDNPADFHKHVYASLMDDGLRIDLFYTRPNHRPESLETMASVLAEKIRAMLLTH